KELERLRQEFLALVSHELRTPLTAIEGVCQLSQQGVFGEFSDEALTVTAMIRKNIRALLNVVNDILDLEKVEAGMMKFDKQEVLLQSLVDALTQNLASVIPASQTFFEVGSDEGFEERTFLADKERLCQSLSSLCKYLHYRNCSGKISIQAERRAQGVRFRISDSGPPVEAKVRQDLFNRFKEHSSRGSSASNFNADLALPLSARIIEAHGGKVILKVGNDESNVFVAALVNEE
ncbi:MAG: HAMP domain-containing histidine kinase, partial [Cyanobacteria bacterium]|nr:HAMP domain-containing histidine kinase [Cyanobacteriota bacterium]